MSKRTFVIFGTLAICLAVLIPLWAFGAKGEEESSSSGEQLFATNCGNCHTLAAAGTEGNFAPDLDVLLAPQGPAPTAEAAKGVEERVLAAIDAGFDSDTPGRMPAGILDGEQAKTVAAFVGREAGK
jgi:mono/diheme cytochrome c family protein